MEAQTPQAEAPQAEVPQAEVPLAEVPQAEVPLAELPRIIVPREGREARKARKKAWNVDDATDSVIQIHKFKKKKRNKAGVIAPTTNESEEEAQEPCGLGCIVLPKCQRFNNIRCFLVVFYFLLLAQGIVFGLVDLSIGTFEMGNKLKTFESIMLSSGYDISSCLVVVFIAYYGRKDDVIKWIGFSSFLVGFGSLLFAFPYFDSENNQLKIEIDDICEEKKITKTCKISVSFHSKYVTSFMLGQTMQGIAGIPLYILAVTFIDDNVGKHSTGIYLGIQDASVTIGYGLGYALGAPLITPSDKSNILQRIVGSGYNENWWQTWWIRFVLVSVMAWSTIIPFLCFPQHIKGTASTKSRKDKKPNFLGREDEDKEFETSIKDLFASIWILMKTPTFIWLALIRASEFLLTIGASEFWPKYIENQFILSPGQATVLSGLALIPGGALGQVFGGVIASKLHMGYKGLMRFIMLTSAISVVLILVSVFVRCTPIPFAGVSEDYNRTGQLGNLTAPCNAHCQCSSSVYSAVCGRDDIGYFSACFAGCTYSKTFHDQKTYFNCSCIDEGLTTSDDQGDFIDARPGKCESNCYKLPLFVVFMFSMIVFSAFSTIPNLLTILRIVSERNRSLALGVTYVILRVLGSIPGPIVFRMVGDSSCTFWDSGKCGRRKSCWNYNTTKMSYLVTGICFSCKVFTILFSAIAIYQYKHLQGENSDVSHIPVKNPKVKKKRKKKTDL